MYPPLQFPQEPQHQAAFGGCNIFGNQDTLFDEMNQHYFKECYIEDIIDFFFGDERSVNAKKINPVSTRPLYQVISSFLPFALFFVVCEMCAYMQDCTLNSVAKVMSKGQRPFVNGASLLKLARILTTTLDSHSLSARSKDLGTLILARLGSHLHTSSSP